MGGVRNGGGGQEGVNVLDLSHFLKNSNLGKNIQTVFLSANILSLLRISPKLDPLGDERPKKTQKGHFMGAECVPKTRKIFNLTTTNAILMKLTTTLYLHNSFNLGVGEWGCWGGVAWGGVGMD